MEPAQWYASLPTFLASASALITGPDGAVLLVKPNYRPHWNVPGGVLEADESPHAGCVRECAEELGLTLDIGGLLAIDWVPPTPERKAWFGFVFDGGTLPDGSGITLQESELDDFAFVPPSDVDGHLPPHIARRIHAALDARASGTPAYLHQGSVPQ
jgi:8-oxo-dGTP diphosphatase